MAAACCSLLGLFSCQQTADHSDSCYSSCTAPIAHANESQFISDEICSFKKLKMSF
jgi:hypothetical protein